VHKRNELIISLINDLKRGIAINILITQLGNIYDIYGDFKDNSLENNLLNLRKIKDMVIKNRIRVHEWCRVLIYELTDYLEGKWGTLQKRKKNENK
jgi:hypothetical protein